MKDDRLQSLLERKARLSARIQKLAAQKQADDRRRDTRRKIVAGAILLAAAQADPGVAKWWDAQKARIAREQDRALFEDA